MGHQPLGLATAAAALRKAGHHVSTLDLAVESTEISHLPEVDLVAISVPMHTAARLGIALAKRIRSLYPSVEIAFYGLYATLLRDQLTQGNIVATTIGGEYEPGLVTLANRLSQSDGVANELNTLRETASFPRQQYILPSRTGLPELSSYVRLQIGSQQRLVGYVEASRGCAHQCTHCPITPVYAGRLRLIQKGVVLADIDQLVEAGADHITFADPDFLNAIPHSLAIIEEMHHRHPTLTFDSTIKVEHLLEHATILPRLKENGALFITSAFESTNDTILRHLEKGHVSADLERALVTAETADIIIRPTWVAHTPWSTAEDFLDLLAFIEDNGLIEHVQPIQYTIRLLLPPGAPLIPQLEADGYIDSFDDTMLSYSWSSSDPRLDALQGEITTIIESATSKRSSPTTTETFREVKSAAYRRLLSESGPIEVAIQPRRTVPGLTESWFC